MRVPFLPSLFAAAALLATPSLAVQGTCCNDGHLREIVFQYTGEDCSATSHTQDADKVNCAGDTFMLGAVHVVATDQEDPNDAAARVWFDGIVALGNTITLDATNAGEASLKPRCFLHVYDMGGAPLMEVEFHASCSQPLNHADQFGAFLLLDCIGEDAPIAETCCTNGKPTELTFAYTGSDCSPTTHNQGSAATCAGDTLNEQIVNVLATDNPDPNAAGATVWYDGIARRDTNFTMSAANGGQTTMDGTVYVHITDVNYGPLMTVSFDSSCNNTLEHGDQFGALLLLSCVSEGDPAPGSCCEDGKVRQLSLTYTGDSCASTTHTQSPDKVNCAGDPAMESLVRILMTDHDDPNSTHSHVKIWFDDIVALGDTYHPDASFAGEDKFSAKSFTYIYDLNGTLLQSIEFHTSCSQPLNAGDQFGALLLIGCLNENDPDVGVPFCAGNDIVCACGMADPLGGCSNTAGSGATMHTVGTSSVTLDDLVVITTGLPPGKVALSFCGIGVVNSPLGDGVRCVGPGGLKMFRYFPTPASATGVYSVGPGLVQDSDIRFSHAHGNFDAGETWGFQTWYRDPQGACGAGNNLSSAVQVTFTP